MSPLQQKNLCKRALYVFMRINTYRALLQRFLGLVYRDISSAFADI